MGSLKESDREQLGGYDPVAEGEQDERGVDLLGLRANLTLSVTERIEKHRRSLASIQWLRNVTVSARSR